MDTFKSIELTRWRQFEHVSIDLSQQLCVMTGPNGCGKTTILNLLGKHFGWDMSFLAASFITKAEQQRLYADAWDAFEENGPPSSRYKIGILTYTGGQNTIIEVPSSNATQYNIHFSNRQAVPGVHIPSHRPPPGYSRLETIPVNPKSAQQHYQAYQSCLFRSYGESQDRNPSVAMKEALIAFAVFGEGNSSVTPNKQYAEILHGFEKALPPVH